MYSEVCQLSLRRKALNINCSLFFSCETYNQHIVAMNNTSAATGSTIRPVKLHSAAVPPNSKTANQRRGACSDCASAYRLSKPNRFDIYHCTSIAYKKLLIC